MKKIVISAAVIFAAFIAVFVISKLYGGHGSDTQDDRPLSPYDEYVEALSEESISRSENNEAFSDLRSKLSEKKFKELFGASTYGFVNEMQTSKLYGEDGCYISLCAASFYNAALNKTSGTAQCYIFTKELEEAGTLFLHGDTNSMSVSINDSGNGGTSIVLKALAKEKDKKYVLLTNGTDTILLDRENNTVGAGSSKNKLDIKDDCYGALEQKGLSISYSDITDEENLIWFEFDKVNL